MDGGLYSKAKSALMSPVGLIVAAAIICLVIYLVWSKQSFMPTATMRYQQNDNVLVMSPEHMCGGMDQCCRCSGNETMAATKYDVTPNDLSKVAMGL